MPLVRHGGGPRGRRFLFFPRGNNSADSISLYLDHVAPKEDASWGLCLQFVLTVHSEDEALTAVGSRGMHRQRRRKTRTSHGALTLRGVAARGTQSRGIGTR
jgi:hypothetical protein